MNELNKAIICLGGNTPDAESRMTEALAFITTLGTPGRMSGLYRTAPEYAGESEPYLNEVLELETVLVYEALQESVKRYECGIRSLNRIPGLVNIDIDIVYWNGAVVRRKDAVAAYFTIGMAKAGL